MVHPTREPDHEYGPRLRAQHSGDDGSLQEYVDPDQESFPFRTVWADSHGTPISGREPCGESERSRRPARQRSSV
jgi:hypothetical protein